MFISIVRDPLGSQDEVLLTWTEELQADSQFHRGLDHEVRQLHGVEDIVVFRYGATVTFAAHVLPDRQDKELVLTDLLQRAGHTVAITEIDYSR